MLTKALLFETRQNRLRRAMEANGLQNLALNPGPTLTYLTGLHFHLMERPTVLLFSVHGTPILLLPELEQAKTQHLPYSIETIPFNDDPSTWQGVFHRAVQATNWQGQAVGVEPARWRFLELDYCQAASPSTKFVSASAVLDSLRLCKDANEIVAMRKSVTIAQEALLATLPAAVPGVSERQLAAELTAQLLHCGSESELPFSPIVASGENTANPHATPSDRRLQRGDLLLFDWGASYDGYISDLTRTFAIGTADEELRRVADVVLQANQAGRNIARAGISASAVDAAARQVIESAGYGQFFIHRTGHGIGMEAHEPPYLHAGNRQALQPGMTFTIEPGIYLPGRGGVRIEDNVVIGENGAETLSSLPRELAVLG
ncbi:MAG: M24 family metallopeptidase [Chloroflexota bacterium]